MDKCICLLRSAVSAAAASAAHEQVPLVGLHGEVGHDVDAALVASVASAVASTVAMAGRGWRGLLPRRGGTLVLRYGNLQTWMLDDMETLATRSS